MNTQHYLNKQANRIRRIARRLIELEAEKFKISENAKEKGYEPDLSYIYAQTNRLKSRQAQLEVI